MLETYECWDDIEEESDAAVFQASNAQAAAEKFAAYAMDDETTDMFVAVRDPSGVLAVYTVVREVRFSVRANPTRTKSLVEERAEGVET